ncbi:MAG: hypothetical protein ACOYOA_06525 [Saprospiraceae bacterium]
MLKNYTYRTNFYRIVLIFALFHTFSNAFAQTNIAVWNFEPLQGTVSSPTANIGAGTAALVIGSGTITGGTATGMSGEGCGNQISGTFAWALNPFSPGTSNEINGAEFRVNTTGQSNISFGWDMRMSNTSPNTIRLKYSDDGGTTWNDFTMTNSNTTFCLGTINNGKFEAANASGDSYRRISVNLSSISAINNNPNVRFRLLASHFQSTGQYRQTNSNTTVATGGTLRFDNVSVVALPTTFPSVNISLSASTGAEASTTAITITATASSPVTGNQYVSVNVSGTGITAGDYSLSKTTITIPSGASSGSATFTVVDDIIVESLETATISLLNPTWGIALGTTNSADFSIVDNDAIPNTAPVIQLDPSTSNFIDGGAIITANTLAINTSLSDPSDAPQYSGIVFAISDAETAANMLSVSVSSSNISVAPLSNLILSGTGSLRTLKIIPGTTGYSTITVTVTDGIAVSNFTLNYALSAASLNPTSTRFHAGASDASTAIGIDANYMFVGDDEDQALRLYDRQNSGLPVSAFDFTSQLGMSTSNIEVDIESSMRMGNRIYWMGSHTNSTSGAIRPNRYRFFATDLSGSGANTVLSYVGRFDDLRTNLLSWDAGNAHGLGADYFGLNASAAAGIIPEEPNGAGFNIEALTISPLNDAAYICFRAPIVPAVNRTKALIVPWLNFAAMVSGNPTIGAAQFGAPIQLDLGGRGIREIKRNANGEYLIIAGPADVATGIAPKDFRLFTWTGNPSDDAILTPTNLTAFQSQGSFEGIVDVPSPLSTGSAMQLLVDNGDHVYYNDGIIAKELAQNNHKKSRSEWVTLTMPTPFVQLKAVAMLQGPFNSSSNKMEAYFTSNNFFPLVEPYSALGYTQIGGGSESTTVNALSIDPAKKAVDWVLLELRSAADPTVIIATRSGLLLQNGEIVDINGVSPLKFNNLAAGSYYIALRHRNHIGIRSQQTFALSTSVVSIDFTGATAVFGSDPLSTLSNGQKALNAGDANRDGSIDAFDGILWELQNGLFDDYSLNADYNMDGSIDALDSISWESNNGKYEEFN